MDVEVLEACTSGGIYDDRIQGQIRTSMMQSEDTHLQGQSGLRSREEWWESRREKEVQLFTDFQNPTVCQSAKKFLWQRAGCGQRALSWRQAFRTVPSPQGRAKSVSRPFRAHDDSFSSVHNWLPSLTEMHMKEWTTQRLDMQPTLSLNVDIHSLHVSLMTMFCQELSQEIPIPVPSTVKLAPC